MHEHRRRSIRLKDYDYSQPGAYFITMCTQNRVCLFGQVTDAMCSLSMAGEMIERKWQTIAQRFGMVDLGPYVIMPNHMHGIIQINAPQSDGPPTDAHTASLATMIQWFKTGTTYDYIVGVKERGWQQFDGRLWQRNYWEHVVRNEKEYERIADYIEANPSVWADDSLHPDTPWTDDGRPITVRRPTK